MGKRKEYRVIGKIIYDDNTVSKRGLIVSLPDKEVDVVEYVMEQFLADPAGIGKNRIDYSVSVLEPV